MGSIELTGLGGTLRAAYHVALRMGAWSITTIAPDTFRVKCHVLHANPAWLSYRPLVLRVQIQSGVWWSFTVEGDIDIVAEDGDRVGTFHVVGDPIPVQGG